MQPYAVTADNTRGRDHREVFLPTDTDPFIVDARRVLHCTAFRRLKHKTQVFVTGEHDHFRTRLTHTLEVADICRRLCLALGVNAELGEVIGMAHDLGHSPFGHAGESALARLMADHGGFEHNAQSLRVVEYLEHPYPHFRGLNLLYEVRESLAKHCTLYDRPGEHPLADGSHAPIEGQVANLADTIAYDCHDLEDAIGAGLVDEGDLAEIELWRQAAEPLRQDHPDAPLAAIRRPILDRLESALLGDVIAESQRRIAAAGAGSVDDVRAAGDELVGYSAAMTPRVSELNQFLFSKIYRHPRLVEMDNTARQTIEKVFKAFLTDPGRLPERYRRRLDDQGLPRVACDYIAGMTDGYCQNVHDSI